MKDWTKLSWVFYTTETESAFHVYLLLAKVIDIVFNVIIKKNFTHVATTDALQNVGWLFAVD